MGTWCFLDGCSEQIGVPIRSMPLLPAAGMLAGTGHLNLWSLTLCSIAAVTADSIWYQLEIQRSARSGTLTGWLRQRCCNWGK